MFSNHKDGHEEDFDQDLIDSTTVKNNTANEFQAYRLLTETLGRL
jgi:hypothetical protein